MSATYFKKWLVDNGYSNNLYTKSLAKNFGAITLKARIGAGTKFSIAQEYLLEIQLANSPHANFLDEA